MTKEDLILLFLDDPQKVYRRFMKGDIKPTNELLKAVLDLGDPELAYSYAAYVDLKPRDSTRKQACKEPIYAYLYARKVDECYHEDTHNAVQKSSWYKRRYADLIRLNRD